MENNYLNFKKKSDNETELYVYGDIRKKDIIERWLDLEDPERTDAFSLKDALNMVDTPNLTVRINSYGGEVSEGLAIYSLLSDFKGHVKTIVDGFACSAASVIFMAGEERVVPESGVLLIHNAWSYAEGDANVMKKMAEDLEKITQPSINIYVNKTGLPEEKIKEMMDREEWITSKEAFELGFSTTQTKNEAMQALEANYMFNLITKLKEKEKEITKLQEENTTLKQKNNVVEIKTKDVSERVEKMVVEAIKEQITKYEEKQLQGNLEENKNNNLKPIKEDAWTSFFNTKN